MRAHAVTGELDGHGSRHGDQRALGRGVMLGARCGFDRRQRGGADQDAAGGVALAGPLDHVPGGGSERIERAVEIDARDPVPFFRAHLGERGRAAPAADAGIGKAAVDPAHLFHGFRERGIDGFFIADIAFQREDLAAGLVQLGFGGGILGGVRTPDRDVGTGLRHRFRHAEPDAAVAAGHECDLSGQIEWCVGHLRSLMITVGSMLTHTRQHQQAEIAVPSSRSRQCPIDRWSWVFGWTRMNNQSRLMLMEAASALSTALYPIGWRIC